MEIPGGGEGRGGAKAKVLQEKYGAKLEFLEGRGWGASCGHPLLEEIQEKFT